MPHLTREEAHRQLEQAQSALREYARIDARNQLRTDEPAKLLYPRLVYKAGEEHPLRVLNEEQEAAALADGWALTTPEPEPESGKSKGKK